MAFFDRIIQTRLCMGEENQPLQACSMCERPLEPTDYFVVAKAYHQGKTVIEAAQCVGCQAKTQDYASEQSLENIMLYSGRRFNQFLQDPLERKLYHLEEPSCLITGEELQTSDSFELYHFNIPGSALEENNFVFVGPTAIEQLGELLSEETRRSWEGFTEQLAPDSPEIVISPMFF